MKWNHIPEKRGEQYNEKNNKNDKKIRPNIIAIRNVKKSTYNIFQIVNVKNGLVKTKPPNPRR